jgi:hypothetical protein
MSPLGCGFNRSIESAENRPTAAGLESQRPASKVLVMGAFRQQRHRAVTSNTAPRHQSMSRGRTEVDKHLAHPFGKINPLLGGKPTLNADCSQMGPRTVSILVLFQTARNLGTSHVGDCDTLHRPNSHASFPGAIRTSPISLDRCCPNSPLGTYKLI